MKISCIMSISKVLTHLWAIRQKIKTKKHAFYNVLVMKRSCKNIKIFLKDKW